MKYYAYVRKPRKSLQPSDPFTQQFLPYLKNCSSGDKLRYGYKVNLKTFQASRLHLFASDYGTTVQELLLREPVCIDVMRYLDHETESGSTNREVLDCLVALSDDNRCKIKKITTLLRHPDVVFCLEDDSNILARELVAYAVKSAPEPRTDVQKRFVSNVNQSDLEIPPYDVQTVFGLQDLCDVPGKWLMCIPDDVSFYGYPPEAESLLAQIKMLPTKYCVLVTNMVVGGDCDGI